MVADALNERKDRQPIDFPGDHHAGDNQTGTLKLCESEYPSRKLPKGLVHVRCTVCKSAWTIVHVNKVSEAVCSDCWRRTDPSRLAPPIGPTI